MQGIPVERVAVVKDDEDAICDEVSQGGCMYPDYVPPTSNISLDSTATKAATDRKLLSPH